MCAILFLPNQIDLTKNKLTKIHRNLEHIPSFKIGVIIGIYSGRRRKNLMNVSFVGGARYSQPLGATNKKKFNALKSLGELFIIGFSKDIRPQWFTEHAHFYLLPLCPIRILRYIELLTCAFFLLLWLIMRRGVQVIIAQSPYEGVVGALAKNIAGWFGYKVALIVESHGDFEESFFLYRRIFFPRIYHVTMKATARFALDNADVLRAISHATCQQLKRWVPEKPIVQFMAWTNIEVFLQVDRQEKREHSNMFLYTGVLTPLKGIFHLVNAFAAIAGDSPQTRLVILGKEQNQEYVRKLKTQIKRLSIERQVRFVPEVPQEQLAQWMARAAAFVLPSLSEGLGRVLVEAMATGTLVIGSRVGGIPEIIRDGKTGFLVPPGNESTLVEKMRWVIEHPQETRMMGERARLFAKQFFSEDVYVQGYARLLAETDNILRN